MTARCPRFGDNALFADYPGDALTMADERWSVCLAGIFSKLRAGRSEVEPLGVLQKQKTPSPGRALCFLFKQISQVSCHVEPSTRVRRGHPE
jgi:hypothetical protein